MKYRATAKFIKVSPYKLRPLVDEVRGDCVRGALNWLSTLAGKRVLPITKVIESAIANARQLDNQREDVLVIREICVDAGPTLKYFRPGAMGRAQVQRRRTSHIRVVLENAESAS
jgi:large subunit ribosomal protein L22